MSKFFSASVALAAILSIPSGMAFAADVSKAIHSTCVSGGSDPLCLSIDYRDSSALNLRSSAYQASTTPLTFSAASVGLSDGNGGVITTGLDLKSTVTTIVVSAVPEPGTYAMLLAGLGAMGVVVQRRRRRS